MRFFFERFSAGRSSDDSKSMMFYERRSVSIKPIAKQKNYVTYD